jgi:hypothetical protein
VPASLDKVLAFAHGPWRPGADAISDPALSRAFDAYRGTGLRRLAGVRVSTATRPYATVYEAIADETIGQETLELSLTDPPAPGPAWEFLRALRRVELLKDGSAEVYPPIGAPQHAIARVLLRESNAPPDAPQPEGRGPDPFPVAFEHFRSGSVVPFSLALLLYLPDERLRFEIDLTDDTLLKDPRAGRLSPGRKVRRPTRISWAIDRKVATASLTLLECRLLELLAEMRSASVEDLALVFGADRETVRSALDRFAEAGFAHLDPANGLYRLLLEAFRPMPGSGAELGSILGPGSPPAAVPGATLHKDLNELIATADAGATCPLCGDPIPPGHAGIVCPRCEAEVSAGPGDP